jgi:hypothetical protein
MEEDLRIVPKTLKMPSKDRYQKRGAQNMQRKILDKMTRMKKKFLKK